ncbi:MAG: hypothetical protein CHACPFDD_00131 [Phycisphaerae bacterium]|nr:hypothetical protein [Phycisphaerae bacterium]
MRLVCVLSVLGLLLTSADAQTRSARKQQPKPRPPRQVRVTESDLPATVLLERRVARVQFEDATLEEAFAWVAEKCRVNLVVKWDKLDEAGVSREQKISFSARHVDVGRVLWLILNQAADKDVKLAYRADPEMVVVSTDEDLGGEMVTRVYDVRDVVSRETQSPSIEIGRTYTTPIGLVPQVAPGAVGYAPVMGRVTSGVRIQFDNNNPDERDDERDAGRERQARRLAQLVDVITTSIEPESWSQNGGKGVIRTFDGKLIVHNTIAVHQKLGGRVTLRSP